MPKPVPVLRAKKEKKRTVKSAIEVFESLEGMGRALNAKVSLLKKHDTAEVKSMISAAYDWTNTYGYVPSDTEVESVVARASNSFKGDWSARLKKFQELLAKLARREVTGNEASLQTQRLLRTFNPLEAKWCFRVLRRDLRVGLATKSFNKAYDNLLPTYSIQKGTDYRKLDLDKHPLSVKTHGIEPKFDGMRLTLVFENGVPVGCYSQNGRDYPFLRELFGNALAPYCKGKNVAFDGEVFNKNWNQTMSIVMKKTLTPEDRKKLQRAKFWVFDMIPLQEFQSGIGNSTDGERRKKLVALFKNISSPNVKLIPRLPVSSWDEARKLIDRFLDEGSEGGMIKDLRAHYAPGSLPDGRSTTWIKYKPFVDVEGTIMKVVIGSGKNSDRLGRFVVRMSNGDICRVGNGFTDKQRAEFWKKRKSLIGKTVQFLVQDDRNAVATARFGIFRRMRDPKAE